MKIIEIKDLYLAAFLKCSGIPLESFEFRNNHTVFIFRSDDRVGEFINQYIRDQASINIKAFRNCLRDLKSLASGDIPIPKNRQRE